MKARNVKVIFDTNVLVSFLIGRRLTFIKDYISNGRITIVTTEDLLNEIKQVTSRERLKKYFPQESVIELLELLETIAENVAQPLVVMRKRLFYIRRKELFQLSFLNLHHDIYRNKYGNN